MIDRHIVFNFDLDKLNSIYSYGINDNISFDLNFINIHLLKFCCMIIQIIHYQKNIHHSFIKEAGSIDNIINHIETTNPHSNKLF